MRLRERKRDDETAGEDGKSDAVSEAMGEDGSDGRLTLTHAAGLTLSAGGSTSQAQGGDETRKLVAS
eukprot:7041-Hanusia_phi.AAC.1